jgi:dTMP kinase
VGKLIVLEGGEGCGKSTQLLALHQTLQGSWLFQHLHRQQLVPDIYRTREPGGTALGSDLRRLLLHQETGVALDNRTELLLYAADRAQHVEELIKPAWRRAVGCCAIALWIPPSPTRAMAGGSIWR